MSEADVIPNAAVIARDDAPLGNARSGARDARGVERATVGEATDAELMDRFVLGEAAAFETLVDRHKGPLVGYLGRLTGDFDRAEDLAQEAFLRLFRSAERYRERGQLTAYLFRIATNLLRSEERRARVWRLAAPRWAAAGHPLIHDREAIEPTGPTRVLDGELRRQLLQAISELPIRFRAPVVLADVEDWPLKRIAEMLGLRVGTVKSRLHRARARLRDRLGPYLDQETS